MDDGLLDLARMPQLGRRDVGRQLACARQHESGCSNAQLKHTVLEHVQQLERLAQLGLRGEQRLPVGDLAEVAHATLERGLVKARLRQRERRIVGGGSQAHPAAG